MVVVAVLLAAGVDRDFQTAIADDLPAALVDPTGGLDRALGRAVAAGARARRPAGRAAAGRGPAPEFAGTAALVQHAGRAAADAAGAARPRRADRLLDLHVHQLPAHAAAPAARGTPATARAGLTIIGVHTPEFPFERDAGNVARRDPRPTTCATRSRRTTPTATWNACAQPVLAGQVPDRRARARALLALRRGRLRRDGGGDPRRCCAEAGRPPGPALAPVRAPSAPSPGVTTPETYLGWRRARRADRRTADPARRAATSARCRRAEPGRVRLRRRVADRPRVAPSRAPARGSTCDFGARRVFLVLGSPGRPRRVRVLLDGRPLPDALAGPDVRDGVAPRPRPAALPAGRLRARAARTASRSLLDPGVRGYAFTFG